MGPQEGCVRLRWLQSPAAPRGSPWGEPVGAWEAAPGRVQVGSAVTETTAGNWFLGFAPNEGPCVQCHPGKCPWPVCPEGVMEGRVLCGPERTGAGPGLVEGPGLRAGRQRPRGGGRSVPQVGAARRRPRTHPEPALPTCAPRSAEQGPPARSHRCNAPRFKNDL